MLIDTVKNIDEFELHIHLYVDDNGFVVLYEWKKSRIHHFAWSLYQMVEVSKLVGFHEVLVLQKICFILLHIQPMAERSGDCF